MRNNQETKSCPGCHSIIPGSFKCCQDCLQFEQATGLKIEDYLLLCGPEEFASIQAVRFNNKLEQKEKHL